jgi:hypothetical protein
MFNSIWKREKAWHGLVYDKEWMDLRKESDRLESLNVGQLINNANSNDEANGMQYQRTPLAFHTAHLHLASFFSSTRLLVLNIY